MTRRIAVVGGGLIGRAWTIVFARAGCDVQLWDPSEQVRRQVQQELRTACSVSGDDPALIERVQVRDALEAALEGVEWVQENGPEKLDVKQALFARMDAIAGTDTILASSSSALIASHFADGLAGRGRILVAHPVNPPHLIPVVELCPSPDTTAQTMDRADTLMREVGQVPVRLSREIDGFVLNRLQAVLLAEALSLVAQGIVTPEGLDDTIRHGLGRRWTLLGPLATINLNAPGGVVDYLERYGPTMARLSDTAARGEAFDKKVGSILAQALPSPEKVPALSTQRDRWLAQLGRHLNQITAEKGES